MSVSLARLRLLQQQAGRTAPTAPITGPVAPVAAAASVPSATTTAPARVEEPVFAWIDREVRHKAIAPAAPLVASTSTSMSTAQPAATQTSSPPTPTGVARAPARDIARDSLYRLLGLRERSLQAPALRVERPLVRDRHLPGDEIAPGLYLVESFVPQTHPSAPLNLAFARRDDSVHAGDLLFFDTETTGLAGGTGTRAFMIGAADWHRDPTRGQGLRIRQLMMATMAAEPAMLDTFASWLGPRTVLSSYNGRCYDAPLLKTRYRLARRPEPLSALDHVDLLFPTRRRYRGTWENCRLATIERQLLRIVREDDLPGSQAPAAWLNYLRGGDAIDLRRVLDHNHQDVVTLAQLMLRLIEAEQADQLALSPVCAQPGEGTEEGAMG
ncbi:MAG TPA: ribonuclease H-like domain-containing protein [Stenotrophomonas sp.]|jgi:uncharacterized protein YprB with RNaseH-like and TPR domain